jgi:hypothetical protein
MKSSQTYGYEVQIKTRAADSGVVLQLRHPWFTAERFFPAKPVRVDPEAWLNLCDSNPVDLLGWDKVEYFPFFGGLVQVRYNHGGLGLQGFPDL